MVKSLWKKVSEIKVGDRIAVVRPGAETVDFDEIVSIKKMGREQVWDIEVEGTHNFVGNGILAHNTYINGQLGVNKDSADVDSLIFNVQNTGANVFSVDAEGDYFYDGTGSSPSADYAEYFATKDIDLVPGDAVCVDVLNPNSVTKCRGASDINIMGIVSTRPALVGNAKTEYKNNPNYKVIAMLGQIPAKVSNENGAVKIGDSLTSSSIPGYLMKANAGDSTVGVALENLGDALDGQGNVGTGTIQVMISRRNKSLTVEAVEEKVTERIAAMKIEDEVNVLVANAVASLTPTNTLTLDENGMVVLLSNPTQSVNLFAGSTELTTLQNDFESLKASIESNIFGFEKEFSTEAELEANTIVSYESGSIVNATSENRDSILGIVKIVDTENSKAVVSTRGRSTIIVTNENGNVYKNDPITVSSANNGVGVKAITEGMIVGYALSDAEYNDENQSIVEIAIAPAWYLSTPTDLSLGGNVVDLSGSTSLTDLTVSGDSLLYGNLNVIGDSRFTNIFATGDLTVGLMKLSSDEGSINVAGGDLKLQDEYGAGNITAFGGKIIMTNTGDVKVLGEITARKYNVDTSDVAGASAGKAVILVGQSEVIVDTNALTEKSLVFVTAENSSKIFTYEMIAGLTDGAGSVIPGVSGTAGAAGAVTSTSVRIYTDSPLEKDTVVNWWIIN